MNNNAIMLGKIFKVLYFIWGLFVLFQQTVNVSFASEITLTRIINVIILFFLIISLIWMEYRYNFDFNLYTILAITSIIFLSIISLKNQMLIYSVNFIFILLSSKVDYKLVLKVYMSFSAIILLSTILLHFLGFIPDFLLSFDSGVRARSSLGFSYYTFSAQTFFFFICAFTVYKESKIAYLEILVLEFINCFIYFYTNTRSPYQLGTIVLLYVFLKKVFKLKGIINHKFLRSICLLSYPIAFSILYYITFMTSDNTFYSLNSLLSNRLALNISAFQQFGVSVLGQKIQFSNIDAWGGYSKTYNYVDSAYFQNLIVNGWMFTIILFFFFTFLCVKAIKRKKDILLVVLATMAIHAMFDPQIGWIWYSPFALLFLNNLNTFKYKDDSEVKVQNESS